MKKRKYFIRFELKDKSGSKLKYIKKTKVIDKFKVGKLKFFIWYYKLGKSYQVIECSTGLMTNDSSESVKQVKKEFYQYLSDKPYSELKRMIKSAKVHYSRLIEKIYYGNKYIKTSNIGNILIDKDTTQ